LKPGHAIPACEEAKRLTITRIPSALPAEGDLLLASKVRAVAAIVGPVDIVQKLAGGYLVSAVLSGVIAFPDQEGTESGSAMDRQQDDYFEAIMREVIL